MFKIVITSINSPTIAVEKYSRLPPNYELLVVGDRKTPDWPTSTKWRMISFDEQLAMDHFSLVPLLPENHYSRKMVGYLLAMLQGVDGIIDTDDDNEPLADYDFPDSIGLFESISENQGWVNIFKYFTNRDVWPRGLPLRNILHTPAFLELSESRQFKVGIFQGLADGDTDLDALFRLTRDNPSITFQNRPPIILDQGTLTPFNSQNTLFFPPAFPLLYLPTTVSFRYTDILRSVVAQPVLWAAGLKLGFTRSTVYQTRNDHDYMLDFRSEVPMYLSVERAAELAISACKDDRSVEDNILNVYSSLEKNGIVQPSELETLDAWLSDLRLMSLPTAGNFPDQQSNPQ
jgi:hypothetical protein